MKVVAAILSMFLSIATAMGQEGGNLAFIPLKAENIPTDEVSSLYQDSEGFIWIVTYSGLVRYDGYKTELYSIRNDSEEYFDGYLHTVIEEDNHRLLVGTERGILSLDKTTGELTKLKDPAFDHLNVTDMVKDKKGRIWVSGDKGIFWKDKGNSSFSKMDLRTDYRENNLTDIIDMLLDDRGNLWITSWHKGLFRYNLNSGRLYSYATGALGEAYVLHQDRQGSLWVGTWGDGLLKVDLSRNMESTLQYTRFSHESWNQTSLLDDIIYDIDEDASGRIWVGSRSGLSIMEGNQFVNRYPDSGFDGLPYNEVNSILRTKDNTMWLGMLGGGVCKVVSSSRVEHRINLDNVKKEYRPIP
jgi:ligand-binding sensor domain-containing protein